MEDEKLLYNTLNYIVQVFRRSSIVSSSISFLLEAAYYFKLVLSDVASYLELVNISKEV